MSDIDKKIVEINGIRMEVDLRHAKIIENYKIGDNVKVLIKSYGNTFNTYPGVIIAFDEFKDLPTITVCYVEYNYNTAQIKFISLNSQSQDCEIVHMAKHEQIVDRARAEDLLNDAILKAKSTLDDLIRKKSFFLENFDKHFNLGSE